MIPSRRAKLSAVVLSLASAAALALGCSAEPADEAAHGASEDPLATKDHRKISGAACRSNGLPEDFCDRVEEEAYNVDLNEWNTLAAHAQPEPGQSQCDAAAAVQDRLRSLGSEVRTLLAAGNPSEDGASHLAKALGRSVHTVQDNCAHHGMSNPQHAWYSVRSWCLSTGEDPDGNPEALDCARRETAVVVRAFRDAVQKANVDFGTLSAASGVWTHNPARAGQCEFLREWKDFDREDGRWDIAVTGPAFSSALVGSFTAPQEKVDLCANGKSIAVPNPRPRATGEDPFCTTLSIYCIGY